MLLNIDSFTGEFPVVQPHLLPDGAAQYASDCDFRSGTLRGIPARSEIFSLPKIAYKTLFAYSGVAGGAVYGSTGVFYAVRGPVANDAFKRFYWSEDSGAMGVSRADVGGNGQEPTSSNTWMVGVPKPNPLISVAAQSPLDFKFASTSGITYKLLCETVDGKYSSEAALTLSSETDTENKKVIKFNLPASFYCKVSNDLATGTDKPVLLRPAVSDGSKTVSTSQWLQEGSTSLMHYTETVSINGVPTVFRYVFNTAWQTDPLQATLYALTSTVDEGRVTYSLEYTYYSVGKGWYCTSSSRTALSDGTSFDTLGNTLGPMLLIKGTDFEIKAREDAGSVEITPEISGLEFKLVMEASTVSVEFWVNKSKTEHRAYTYTYVNQWGEEGPPADPVEIDCLPDQAVALKFPASNASGYVPVDRVRLYRTATGQTTDFSLVKEITFPLTTYTDSVKGDALGETIATRGYYPPPLGLKNLISLPNGIIMATKGNEIWFSEPYLAYAWNPDNVLTTATDCVGACAGEGGAYVTTYAHPYFVSGMTPDAMGQTKITSVQAGVSSLSICNLGSAVVWASNDGLVFARGVDVSMDYSFKFFSRDAWRKLCTDANGNSQLSKMRLNAHDGRLLIWFDGNVLPAMMLRYDEANPSLTRLSEPITAMMQYPLADTVYVVNGVTTYDFCASLTQRNGFVWYSKEFLTPSPVNFGCVQLRGTGSAKIDVYADGALKFTSPTSILSSEGLMLRLPAGFRASRWSFKITGSANTEIWRIAVATSPVELQHV